MTLKKAMILAAGKGERMRPLTLTTPKPLVEVNGKALIVYHLEKLAAAGFSDVVINISWLGEKIEDALGNGKQFGLNIIYSREPEPLETAGAIRFARELLGEGAFALVNADVYSELDYSVFQQCELGEQCWGQLFFVANPEHKKNGDFALSDSGLVTEKGGHSGLTFSGLSVLQPAMVYNFPSNEEHLALRKIFEWAITQEKLRGERFEGLWSDVGTLARLKELERVA